MQTKPEPQQETNQKWLGDKGFDEAKYYNDEKYEIGIDHSDGLIKEKILEAYSRHYSLAVAEINVEVKEGVVFLSGTVQGHQEKKEASDLISHFTGVKAVRNDLGF